MTIQPFSSAQLAEVTHLSTVLAKRVTQADLARAIRAMRSASYPNVRVVLRDGGAIVEPVPESGTGDTGENDLDRWLRDNEAREAAAQDPTLRGPPGDGCLK